MKNATKHADELKSLFKRLLREGKPEMHEPMEPVDALVRGAMTFDVPDARVEEAMKLIGSEFVDLNELRVATDLEIQEILGTKYPAIGQRVGMITLALNDIFEREHTMRLERLKTISKRDARQFLRELPEINAFVEAYVMLMALDGHTAPLDKSTLDYLVDQGIIDEQTSIEDAQKFIEHHLKAEEMYDFFTVMHRCFFRIAEEKN